MTMLQLSGFGNSYTEVYNLPLALGLFLKQYHSLKVIAVDIFFATLVVSDGWLMPLTF
jgi:hypothetical protein